MEEVVLRFLVASLFLVFSQQSFAQQMELKALELNLEALGWQSYSLEVDMDNGGDTEIDGDIFRSTPFKFTVSAIFGFHYLSLGYTALTEYEKAGINYGIEVMPNLYVGASYDVTTSDIEGNDRSNWFIGPMAYYRMTSGNGLFEGTAKLLYWATENDGIFGGADSETSAFVLTAEGHYYFNIAKQLWLGAGAFLGMTFAGEIEVGTEDGDFDMWRFHATLLEVKAEF